MRIWAEFAVFAFIFVFILGFGVKEIIVRTEPSQGAANISEAVSPITGIKLPNEFSTTTLSNLSKIGASGATLIYVDENGARHSLFSKNADKGFSPASITKLMTAVISYENIPKISVNITKEIHQKRGASKKLLENATYTTETLFRAMLIESNNDAAWAFALNYGLENFLSKMNEKAKIIGMKNTNFLNPVGLDGATDFGANETTANDLVSLAGYVYEKQPQIFEISRFKETIISDVNGKNVYTASTTNELLLANDLPVTIVGGKTGETPKSGKNLLLIFKKEPYEGHFISVVLNSKNNFEDTKKIISEIQ